MTDFNTILTTLGTSRIATAHAAGLQVDLTQICVGDGNGDYYTLDPDQTELENQVFVADVNRKYVDPENPSWVIIEAVIPADEGPFWIREAGILNDAGELMAVGLFPTTYKPVLSDGCAKSLLIRFYMEVSYVDAVTLSVDESIVYATVGQLNDESTKLNRRAWFYNNCLM